MQSKKLVPLSTVQQSASNKSSISRLLRLRSNGAYLCILCGDCSPMFRACSRSGRRAGTFLFASLVGSLRHIMPRCLHAAIEHPQPQPLRKAAQKSPDLCGSRILCLANLVLDLPCRIRFAAPPARLASFRISNFQYYQYTVAVQLRPWPPHFQSLASPPNSDYVPKRSNCRWVWGLSQTYLFKAAGSERGKNNK